ncbi:predicted protein [Arabidopsis lyrata subsp. lyrata]|uniref:Predicted protein n=1 Tax=Arabidopsis lyrata subsp. lyrata TaxID=81972 RepID=D7MHQ1_ARALL|nr:predicted protein [Arabidopsis lyrata subsp. lyrata]
MARTKNATVVPTEHEADPVLGEEEEELPREDPGKEPEDYEEAEQNSMMLVTVLWRKSQENAVVGGVRVSRRKVAPKKVSKKGLVEQLQKQLEDGFRRINKKFDGFDKRLKCVESDVKSLKEASGKANELDKRGEEKYSELEEDEIEESGGEDKENASELEEDENGEDGEKDKEFEENDNGEDGEKDKELEENENDEDGEKDKELEENENGDNGEKEKEGDLEGNDLDGDNEKEGDLERNDLDGDKEKEKEESSEKRQQVKKKYERKRTRKTSAEEQEEEVQVGKKAKVTKKKVGVMVRSPIMTRNKKK